MTFNYAFHNIATFKDVSFQPLTWLKNKNWRGFYIYSSAQPSLSSFFFSGMFNLATKPPVSFPSLSISLLSYVQDMDDDWDL